MIRARPTSLLLGLALVVGCGGCAAWVPHVREPCAWGFCPAVLVEVVAPAYPNYAWRTGLEGSVDLEVLVDERGLVESARVRRSSDPVFEGAAVEAARLYRFAPALRDGHVVRCRTDVTVEFRLGPPRWRRFPAAPGWYR